MANNLEVAVLTFIKTEYEANKAAVLPVIQSAEGGVEGFLVNAIKTAPKPSGILGQLYTIFEPSLEGYVTTLVQTVGPEVVYDFIDTEITNALSALGG